MIVDISDDVAARVRELRRDIHRHPELGFEEERTAALVERELSALNVDHRRVAKTGVVGIIRGGKPGHTVALRADMDALPITERTDLPFASEVPGKMHACGHDAHTAMLMGAARVLGGMRAQLAGAVVLVFQPAEEGPGGAEPLIAAGVLDDPKVEAIAMLHVDPRLEPGQIGITPGPVNASADEFAITVRGQGGHGAYPHTAVDTIPATAAMILALQNIAARETDPLKSVVVSVGTIKGGYRNNVIADEVKLTGTFRAHDPEIRKDLEARARRILDGVGQAYGVKTDLHVDYGYPPVVNNVALAKTLLATCANTAASTCNGPHLRWAPKISPTTRSAFPVCTSAWVSAAKRPAPSTPGIRRNFASTRTRWRSACRPWLPLRPGSARARSLSTISRGFEMSRPHR